MHGEEVFEAATSFPPGKLQKKRQAIERMLNFPNYQTLGAAKNVAQVVHKRWVWCNVYQQCGYGVVSTNVVGKHYTIVKYPSFMHFLGCIPCCTNCLIGKFSFRSITCPFIGNFPGGNDKMTSLPCIFYGSTRIGWLA